LNAISDIPSPCVQVCQLDPVSNVCRGCQRTLREIADWMDMSPQEKKAVLARIESLQTAR